MLEYLILGTGLGLISYAFYKWSTLHHDYFEKRGFQYLKPTFLLGNSGQMLLQLHPMDTYLKNIYEAFPKAKIVGMFEFRMPMYLLRDPDIIKRIVVKDFDYFEDHKMFLDPTVDQMFGNSLIMLRGEKWRDMRATLSPAFTGSKMRLMFGMVSECAADMVQVLRERTAATGSMRADMKDLFGRYSTDVIATAAFGLKVNSFADENNEFFINGKRAMNFTTVATAIRMVVIRASPSLARTFGIQMIDPVASNFFRNMSLDTIYTRIKEKIYRPDVINLLMQLKTNIEKGESSEALPTDEGTNDDSAGFATVEESHIGKERVQRQWTDTELAAQCFLFFAAGFDTTSTLLSFLTYELALNPEVQQKLFNECRQMRDQLNGKPLGYDSLQRMEYMDQVVCESLRKWPPALIIDRMCVRDYEYDDGELQFEVKEKWSMWIPIYALHRDPQYFPQPESFQPERFSEERKHLIVPGSYIPFGVGPRNCIGSRFALMEVKAIVYHILLQFRVETTAETHIPMRLAPAPGSMKPEKPIILALSLREV